MIGSRHLRRVLASSVRSIGRAALPALVLTTLALSGVALAQGLSEQQIRCMQLDQELAAARGGGANSAELGHIEQQIAQQDRIFQGTQAAMEDAGCYERMMIFGRALKRNPKCLNMNNRVEDARRQLARLQEQRQSLQRGGGNKRRQAELQQALARSGCGAAPRRSGGGLFDFFGGQDREPEYQTPIYRSINPNGRYRTVCVRLCDGFYYPLHYSVYGSQVAQDAEQCQATCAAPAELYVYHNPGQEIEQAISLSGSAYMDLPVALKFRKEFVKGCSCKQTEYNPTEIEAANKKADAGQTTGATPAKAAAAPALAGPAAPEGEVPQLDLDVTGSAEPAEQAPAAPAEEVEAEITPPPPPTEAEAPGPPPPPAAQSQQGQSTITKTAPRTSAN